jgi:hypothetical protein
MNTPIFINFLRAHYRRQRLVLKDRGCTVGEDCLACGLLGLTTWYWAPERTTATTAELKAATIRLWKLCLKTFWGHESKSTQDVGPIDHDEEYHPESFLLYFLAAMQRQLEAIPRYILNSCDRPKLTILVNTRHSCRCLQYTLCEDGNAPTNAPGPATRTSGSSHCTCQSMSKTRKVGLLGHQLQQASTAVSRSGLRN